MRCLWAALVLAIGVSSSAAAAAGDAPPDPPASEPTPTPTAAPRLQPSSPSKKLFLPALLEVSAFNLIPNLWNCYVRAKECVTPESWRNNWSRGFAYDPDKFVTNQLSHPQQGGLYYAAARANGFDLWESAAFTAFGSLTWEMFGETTRPSTNDLLTTTLGGVAFGETGYRLSELVFDDSERGFRRFLREVAGLAVAPGRAFQRLFSGDAWRVRENPEREKPGFLAFEAAGGWIHVESQRLSPGTVVHDRATLEMELRYGNLFEKDLGKPFSSFWLSSELTNGKEFVSRVQTEGILSGRRLDDAGPAPTVLGATFVFDYVNVDLAFGQQAFGFGAFVRTPLGRGWEAFSSAEGLASFGAVHSSEDSVVVTYRNYDYGFGGGVRARLRLKTKGRDVLRLFFDDVFLRTANGPTRWNEVRIGNAEARWPFARSFALAAAVTVHRHWNVLPRETQQRVSRQARVTVVWDAWSGAP